MGLWLRVNKKTKSQLKITFSMIMFDFSSNRIPLDNPKHYNSR